MKTGTYKNGQTICRKDQDILSYFYKSGVLKARGPFLDEKMEGEWHFFHENGSLAQIGHFRANQKHGAWVRYNRQGEA
jgi:antitoxin component YwqK of YwqJK toxin-antitoxin module